MTTPGKELLFLALGALVDVVAAIARSGIESCCEDTSSIATAVAAMFRNLIAESSRRMTDRVTPQLTRRSRSSSPRLIFFA